MADVADRVPGPRLALGPDGVHAHEHAEASGILRAKPRLELWISNQGHRTDALSRPARVVGLQENRDPIVRSEGGPEEPERGIEIDGQDLLPYSFVSTTLPVNVACW